MTTYRSAIVSAEERQADRDAREERKLVDYLIRRIHSLQTTPSRPDDYRAQMKLIVDETPREVLFNAIWDLLEKNPLEEKS